MLKKLLIMDGAHVDAADSSGRTPLNLAAGYGHLEIVKVRS